MILNDHLRRHEGFQKETEQIRCEYCDTTFQSRYNLECHLVAVHYSEKSMKCDLCESGFNTKGTLTRHIKTVHQSVKDHFCKICQKYFSQKGNLQTQLMLSKYMGQRK